MRLSVYVPLAVCVILTVAAPRLVRRLRPAYAVRILTATAVIAATASTWGMVLLAGVLVGQAPVVAEQVGYSRLQLDHLDPVPALASLAAIVVLVLAGWRLGRWVAARVSTARRIHQAFPAGGPHAGELVVLPDDQPFAVAVPGGFRRRGRIVVSAGMLRSLSAPERRVLLAHERCHLTAGHHRHEAFSAAAAALNPMLVGLRRAVAFGVERWADEDAADAVHDRELTAQAVTAAALASARWAPPRRPVVAGLGLERLGVAARVAALSQAPVRDRHLALVGVTALVTLVMVLAAGDATFGFAHLVVAARH